MGMKSYIGIGFKVVVLSFFAGVGVVVLSAVLGISIVALTQNPLLLVIFLIIMMPLILVIYGFLASKLWGWR